MRLVMIVGALALSAVIACSGGDGGDGDDSGDTTGTSEPPHDGGRNPGRRHVRSGIAGRSGDDRGCDEVRWRHRWRWGFHP